MTNYSLKTILFAFTKKNGKHRTVYNGSDFGLLGNRLLTTAFILLPLLGYWALFNDYVFGELGIATAIVGYIVFLVVSMQIIVYTIWNTKRRVVKKLQEPWNHFFPDTNLKLVLENRLTPYSEFFSYLSKIDVKNISDDDLYIYLQNSFKEMEVKNKDLLDAMKRDNKL